MYKMHEYVAAACVMIHSSFNRNQVHTGTNQKALQSCRDGIGREVGGTPGLCGVDADYRDQV